jgi:hypothetical protein
MCPIKTIGRPGMMMSHTCVDCIYFLLGKCIVRGKVYMCLLLTLVLSMIKMEVAPVSTIAWFVAIVSAFIYCSMGVPNNAQAVATIKKWDVYCFKNCNQFDVTTVALSSPQDEDTELIEVGSKDNEVAENKLLHLCANDRISTPHRQLFRLPSRTNLHILVVHGSYPATMKCWAFTQMYPA